VKVSVKVTVPLGTLAGVVISATVAATLAVQLVAPRAMLHETFGILVDVVSLGATVTGTNTSLNSVAAVALVPLTVTLKGLGVGTEVQLTLNTFAGMVAVQVAGTLLANTENETTPANPFIALVDIVEVPAGPPAWILMEGGVADNEKS
jgi:hypothetical protein